MNIEFKTIPANIVEVKSGGDQGVVDHLLSVYDVEDLVGDIAHKGMFTKTLSERQDAIKVVDSHRRDSVYSVIGIPVKFWEVGRDGLPESVRDIYPDATGGLMVRTKFLLDTPEGMGAFTRIKAGAVNQFSYGYEAHDYDLESKSSGGTVRHLRTVKLWEYGPVVFGALPAAVSVSAKSNVGPTEYKNPWDVFKEDDEWCVYKVDEDGNKVGDSLGCHDSKDEARKQVAALHANVDEEEKSLGVFKRFGSLASAFSRKYGYQDEYFRVVEVFEDHLVVTSESGPYYYRVDYNEVEGKYTFTEPDSWVEGTLEFVPLQEGETESAADELKHRLFELEIELGELDLELGRAG